MGVFFRNDWINLNDDSTGMIIGAILGFIYEQCQRCEENKESIRKLILEYLNSREYFDIDFTRQCKRLLYGAMLELEEIMDPTDLHDPHEEEYYELFIKYHLINESNDMPFVDTIKQMFGIEGDRDFVVSLIRKFIDGDI